MGDRWCAFMMARDEGEMIADTVAGIRNQTVPPARIHILDDGSTDSTGAILNQMGDVVLTRVPPHPPQHSEKSFLHRRYALMREAAADVDWVVSVDADTELPPDYVRQITRRMRADGVAVASGFDPTRPLLLPIEPGMVIDAGWLRMRSDMPRVALTLLPHFSLVDGHPSVVYRTIPLRHKRKFGVGYGKDVWKYRGYLYRMAGLSFPLFLPILARVRSFRFLLGYLTYDDEMMPGYVQEHFNAYYVARVRRRLGLASRMFQEQGPDVYVLPKNHGAADSTDGCVGKR